MSEEDTVTVGQDLVKLEAGGAPEKNSEQAAEKPKEPAAPSLESEKPRAPQPTSSSPGPEKAPSPTKSTSPGAEAPKPAQQDSSKPQGSEDTKPALGAREERRVS